MKIKKYQASQLDPRAVVVPIKEFDKKVRSLKLEITKAYISLYNIGRIDEAMRDYLVQRIENM